MRVGEVSSLGKLKRSTPRKLLVPTEDAGAPANSSRFNVDGCVGVAGNLRPPPRLLGTVGAFITGSPTLAGLR